MKYLFIYPIKAYRWLKAFYIKNFAPNKLPTCRFYPTCSEYALNAFHTESVPKALFHTVKRIVKCHPFRPYTIDKN